MVSIFCIYQIEDETCVYIIWQLHLPTKPYFHTQDCLFWYSDGKMFTVGSFTVETASESVRDGWIQRSLKLKMKGQVRKDIM